MSSTTHRDHQVATPGDAPRRDLAQIGLAAVTAVIGAYTIYDASTLQVGFADPVGPRIFPYAIGTGLLVTSALLVVAALRGDRPEAEGGEDVDLDVRADWVTVAKLVGIIGITIATIGFLGWAISGAILFAGSAWALGSRTLVRDVIVGCVLAVVSWYAFYSGLGIPLSAGILDGIL
ncbi:tripartite tricarboxylate transporter TctB family protein [Nocardioides hankookensis]|uniref:Tripartite tricarboxylate transporter TctB family protein n=1 Tax=Nocardioides hankookensis TaxID=443157 RepID=A0ABW1LNN1_9ACTN